MRPLPVLLALLSLLAGGLAAAEPLLTCDFEQGADLKAYPALTFSNATGEIVAAGPDGAGHCLKIVNTAPGKYCQAGLKGPFPMQKNLVLSFDHKEQIEGGNCDAHHRDDPPVAALHTKAMERL